jgi:YD repeat-containing protein
MSDRRTFLGNAAAAVVMAKIPSLTSFGFATDGPKTIGATMSDREKAGLRGLVRTYVEGTILPDGSKHPITTECEYSPDGKFLATRTSQSDGSEWVTTQTYDADGRLVKIIWGKIGEPNHEVLYRYDDAGRLLTITNSPEEGGRVDFHYDYDEQGRKTTIRSFNESRARWRYGVSPWDAVVKGSIGVPVGGKVATICDDKDQPTEAQIHNREGRILSRVVRSYDAHGRIIEEKQIQENPVWLLADRFSAEERAQLSIAMKSLLNGRNGTGISYAYAYDAQGRVTEMRQRNFAADKVTTTSYNEHGDKSLERETITGNSAVPASYSVDENGTLIPDKRTTEPTESPDWPPREQEVRYAYQYDSYGNWTQQTVNRSYSPEEPYFLYRKLTYY